MRTLLVVTIALVTACSAASAQTRPSLEARFIGNMAFAISDGSTTLFTDFPYQSGYSRYMTYDAKEILSRTARSLALITHRHADHWEPALLSATNWSVIGPADAVNGAAANRIVRGRTVDARRIVIYHHEPGQTTVPGCSANCSVPRQGETLRLSTSGQAGGGPDDQPEVFGAGVLSVGEVFRGSFTPDGRTIYFFKKVVSGQEEYRIFSSQLRDGAWSRPERVTLGGDFSDTYPALSRDGRRMVFASYRPAPGAFSSSRNAYLWQVERRGDGWSEPVFLEALNDGGQYHAWADFGSDGALYFRRVSPDWRSQTTLVSQSTAQGFSRPVVYDAIEACRRLRPDLRIVGGVPGPDGSTVFLDVGVGTGGNQQADIWFSRRTQTGWSEPRPFGPSINTPAFETFPFTSPDGRDLFFVRGFQTFYRIPLARALATAGQ